MKGQTAQVILCGLLD